ncbi:helix-turn-helix domain-containing protein [Streptomyces sp. NPDC050507]|uniref:helix-turn-helix domain-containing protein n=1 Tax=Streptomyces sp. NPDC050507 TaxID=3365619 RepID=UPI0037B7CFD8
MATIAPTARQRRLGRVLKELRVAARMTQPEAASVLRCTEGKISRIENALSGVREIDLELLLNAYGVGDEGQRAALEKLRREAKGRGWWTRHQIPRGYADYAALEEDASEAYNVETTLIPGLLQTPDYTRAMLQTQFPNADPDTVETFIAVKQERKQVLGKPSPLTLWAVISESVLKHIVGSQDIMRNQLRALVETAEQYKNVNLLVLPESSGAHAGLFGPFVILSFPESTETDVVYLDGLKRILYLEEPHEVTEYRASFQSLMKASMDHEKSKRYVAQLADNMK